jgi:hypothetical protein
MLQQRQGIVRLRRIWKVTIITLYEVSSNPHLIGETGTLMPTTVLIKTKAKLRGLSGLYRPSDRRLSVKLVQTFADRVCHLVSVTDPYGRILGFLDRSSYFYFQVALQLCSGGCVFRSRPTTSQKIR